MAAMERRQHRRILVPHLVGHLRLEEALVGRGLLVGDISLGGLFLHAAHPPAVGRPVRLELHHPRLDAPLQVRGQVASCCTGRDAADGRVGVGVRFEALPVVTQARLNRLIGELVAAGAAMPLPAQPAHAHTPVPSRVGARPPAIPSLVGCRPGAAAPHGEAGAPAGPEEEVALPPTDAPTRVLSPEALRACFEEGPAPSPPAAPPAEEAAAAPAERRFGEAVPLPGPHGRLQQLGEAVPLPGPHGGLQQQLGEALTELEAREQELVRLQQEAARLRQELRRREERVRALEAFLRRKRA